MGNNNAKANTDKQFTADEMKILETSFRAAAGHSDKMAKVKLLEHWSTLADSHLASCTANFLFTTGQRRTTIDLTRFAEPYYIVERGTTDEKLFFIVGSLDKTNSDQLLLKELEIYVTSVFKTFINMQTLQNSVAFQSWTKLGYQSAERTILAFGKGLLRSLSLENEHFIDFGKLERWLQVNATFLMIWKEVFQYIYSKIPGKTHTRFRNILETRILPINEGIADNTHYTPIIDLPHIIFINSNLPNEHRHKWRFLFSSKIMGESFSTMIGKITNKGPTLLLIEDEDCYIFGGYAPESWAYRPTFVGDDSSMLLTLSPAMRCFNATGYNEHFQYLNINQQTMPNGLGMGGQFNYWGLWLDREYGLGQSSETCTTYRDYVQLSKRKEFRIRNLEVWGIGDEPKSTEDSDNEEGSTNKQHSVLDKNMEDRVMLELSGKHMHSDGLREPDMDL